MRKGEESKVEQGQFGVLACQNSATFCVESHRNKKLYDQHKTFSMSSHILIIMPSYWHECLSWLWSLACISRQERTSCLNLEVFTCRAWPFQIEVRDWSGCLLRRNLGMGFIQKRGWVSCATHVGRLTCNKSYRTPCLRVWADSGVSGELLFVVTLALQCSTRDGAIAILRCWLRLTRLKSTSVDGSRSLSLSIAAAVSSPKLEVDRGALRNASLKLSISLFSNFWWTSHFPNQNFGRASHEMMQMKFKLTLFLIIQMLYVCMFSANSSSNSIL